VRIQPFPSRAARVVRAPGGAAPGPSAPGARPASGAAAPARVRGGAPRASTPEPVSPRGGFSLTELLVVVALLGLVMAAAVPNFGRLVARDRVDAASQEVVSALILARQKALARRTDYRVTLAGSPAVISVARLTDDGWVDDPVRPLTLHPGIQATALFGGDAGNQELLIGPQGLLLAEDAPALITLTNDRADSAVVRMLRTGRVRADVH